MNVLAVDPGTVMGYATGHTTTPRAGVIDYVGSRTLILRRGDAPGVRYILQRAALDQLSHTWPPDLLVYERSFQIGHQAAEIYHGFTAHLQSWCEDRRVLYRTVHSNTLKKFATGKGNAKKEAMLHCLPPAVRKMVRGGDDNMVDAAWMLLWAFAEGGLA